MKRRAFLSTLLLAPFFKSVIPKPLPTWVVPRIAILDAAFRDCQDYELPKEHIQYAVLHWKDGVLKSRDLFDERDRLIATIEYRGAMCRWIKADSRKPSSGARLAVGAESAYGI